MKQAYGNSRDRTTTGFSVDALTSSRRTFDESAVFALTNGGFVSTWDRDVESVSGFAADDILGEHFSVLFLAEDRQCGTPDRLLCDAGTDGRVSIEGWRVRPDGSRYWASGVIYSLRDGAGRLRGFRHTIRDETNRYHTQTEAEIVARRAEAQRIAALIDSPVQHLIYVGAILKRAEYAGGVSEEARHEIARAARELDDAIGEICRSALDAVRPSDDAGVSGPSLVPASDLERSHRYARQLQHALESRIIIEQAKGVLARHYHIKVEQAFERLRCYARSHNTEIHKVAHMVVDLDLRP